MKKIYFLFCVSLLVVSCLPSCVSIFQQKPIDQLLPAGSTTIVKAKPIEPMTVPEKPDVLDVEGIVQVPAGEWTNKAGRKFSVGQGGGAFLPKKALEELKYKIRIWQHYAEELEGELEKGNKRIQDYNQTIVTDTKK